MKASISTPSGAKPGTVQNIQALRGIAALLVVWVHIKFLLSRLCPEQLYPIFDNDFGGIGVDFFFVISGYVITMAAAKRHHSAFDFMLARVARVCPLYLVITLGAIVFVWIMEPAALTFCSLWNGFFYLPLFDGQTFSRPPLNVGWTLSYEMWFYLVFALLLIFFTPQRVSVLLPLGFAIGVLATIFYTGRWYFPRFMFNPMVLEFSFGCVIYHLQRRFGVVTTWILLAAAPACLFILASGAVLGVPPPGMEDGAGDFWRVAVWGVPGALLVAGLIGLERNGLCVMPQVLLWLGQISYSMYLVHWVPLMLLGRFGGRLGLHNPYPIAVTFVASVILCAWLCYTFLENPLTTRAQKLARDLTSRRRLPDVLHSSPVTGV